MPPEVAQGRIYEAARRAVKQLEKDARPESFRVNLPVTLTIEFPQSNMADRAAILPGAERDGRQVSYTAADMVTAFGAMRSALALAG